MLFRNKKTRLVLFVLVLLLSTLAGGNFACAADTANNALLAGASPESIGLIIFGICLIIIEGAVPSFGILGIAGITAFLLGIAGIPNIGLNSGIVWAVGCLWGLISIVSILAAIKSFRTKTSTGTESMIGQKVEVIEWNKKEKIVRIEGEDWKAYSDDDDSSINKGDILEIVEVNRLRLKVKKSEQQTEK